MNIRRQEPQGKTILSGSAARSLRTFSSAQRKAESRSPDTIAGRPQQAASRKTATGFPEAFMESYEALPTCGNTWSKTQPTNSRTSPATASRGPREARNPVFGSLGTVRPERTNASGKR
ncbi:MAG: hypothetical protein FIA93_05250 [Deltaproteobacteria bacterium]|nr:hypothetical protein [Deltaproteobacteria bacterium]